MRKSYTGLVLWIALYCAAMAGACLLPMDSGTITRIILGGTCMAVTLLMLIIERSGHTYWINGVTFEDCVKAGPERCRLYARRHLKRFGKATAVYLILSLAFHLLGWPWWIDMIIMTIGSVAVAISTIRFAL